MKTANIIFLALLAFILVQQANPVEVGWTRCYSESDKTRIVFCLDEIPQYKTYYNQEDNTICITMSDARLGKPNKRFNVNNQFVSFISLKQTDIDTVDIKISLPKPANYKVFDIKSPALIIVDVTSAKNVLTTETSANSPKEPKADLNTVNENADNSVKIDTSVKTDTAENIKALPAEPTELSVMDFQWQALESLNGNVLAILQYIFDLLILSAVIYVIIKIRSINKLARYIRRNRRRLKDNPIFADMLNEIEKGYKQNSEKETKKKTSADKEKTSKETMSEDKKDINDESSIKQYDKVQELAKKGIDPISISQKSNIPVGEVNLILDLIRARKDS